MSKISQYGSIKGNKIGKNNYGDIYQIQDIVEKPSVEKAPSNLAAIGRYVFTPEIFDAIKKTKPGVNNELQIADSIVILGRSQKVYATSFTGKRYDIGDKLGYIQAIIDFSLENWEIGKDLRKHLKNLYL
jgi:UTP--glucose-1-phosphate uridylyltransferase